MPFSRPTLRRLITRVQSDIESFLENGASRIRRSVEWVLAKAMAGLAHGLHGHIQYVSQQIVPDTADDEFAVRWAAVWGVERNAATFATFDIMVTGEAEAELVAGTTLTNAAGVAYTTDDDATIPATLPFEVVVTVTAVAAGADGNAEVGATLSLASPVAGIDAEATVQGSDGDTVGGGADIESIAALKQRLLDRIQTPPSGGGPGDWVDWAKEVDGVTRAWELPNQLGPGTVVVLFVQDLFDSDGNFIDTQFPGGDAITEVQEYLESVAPVIAVPTALAPVELQLNPVIQLEPNTADVQTQVTIQLQDMLLRRASPGGTLLLSEIREAISIAIGETNHVVTSPSADVETDATELITLGTPVYSAIP
jgi:uncharacterized phage protein gp47/JayE